MSRLERADQMLDRMILLSRADGAVDLRVGELLATLREMDLRLLGYSSFSAFLIEEVDFERADALRLTNLAASPLSHVKAALCQGTLPATLAVKAVGHVGVDEQESWVEGVRSGAIRFQRKAGRARVDLEDKAEVALVHEERLKARTILGYPCTDEGADTHILRCWRDRVDGQALVREAMEPRDPPPPHPVHWDPEDDPAADVLGPRVVPRDLAEGMSLLRDLLGFRRTRHLELGLLYHQMLEEGLYRELGFSSLGRMVKASLPLTQKSLQNYRDEVQALSFYPELLAALATGMGFARLMAVYSVATEGNIARWLAVANRTTVTELRRAVRWAEETVGSVVLESYEKAIEATNDLHSRSPNSEVALRAARRPIRPPRWMSGVHPDLVEACRWYRENVRLPKQVGFQRVKERERYTCESPLCNRTTARSHAHHKRWKTRGGPDEDWNAANVCTPCHLRVIHVPGFVEIASSKEGPDVWTFANGRRFVVF